MNSYGSFGAIFHTLRDRLPRLLDLLEHGIILQSLAGIDVGGLVLEGDVVTVDAFCHMHISRLIFPSRVCSVLESKKIEMGWGGRWTAVK